MADTTVSNINEGKSSLITKLLVLLQILEGY